MHLDGSRQRRTTSSGPLMGPDSSSVATVATTQRLTPIAEGGKRILGQSGVAIAPVAGGFGVSG
jgi:hypothetical protein